MKVKSEKLKVESKLESLILTFQFLLFTFDLRVFMLLIRQSLATACQAEARLRLASPGQASAGRRLVGPPGFEPGTGRL